MPLEVKLRDGDFKFIERLLYDQKRHDSVIAELEAELDDMLPDYSKSLVRFSHNPKNRESSEPEEWTIIRNESLRAKEIIGELRRRKRHRQAVSKAMESLDDLESQLVFLKYHLEKSSRDCWRSMGLQKSRWYEMRKEVVHKVAKFLVPEANYRKDTGK